MAADLGEIWKALRTTLLAESQLTTLLASNTAIYFGPIDQVVPLPALIMKPQDDNPIGNASFTGIWRPELQIDILAVDPFAITEICGILDEVFTIPMNRTAAIESDNMRITRFIRMGGSQTMPTASTIEDQPVRVHPTRWKCRIAKKTA